VLAWPDASTVAAAVRRWAAAVATDPRVRRVGYFGSYARGDWGVGSDVDLVVLVDRADEPFARRGLAWDLTELPVPAQVLVYTVDEWNRLAREGSRFHATLAREAVWVLDR
jgi:predicted nucleotidyltransferase